MDVLTVGSAFRVLLFGGCFFFTLAIAAFIAFDTRRRWSGAPLWLAVSLTAWGLTVPALGFAVMGPEARLQGWVVLFGWTALSGVLLSLFSLSLYAAMAAQRVPFKLATSPAAQAERPRPHFQAVCRNPKCRAPLESGKRACPVCGWDQRRPIAPGQKPPPEPSNPQPGKSPPAALDGPLAYLVVRSGPRAGSNVRLYHETVVGSGPDCELVLQDAFVGPEHATIRRKGKAYVFYDMSENGSFLIAPAGKKRLDAPHTLRHGDKLELGNTLLVFMMTE